MLKLVKRITMADVWVAILALGILIRNTFYTAWTIENIFNNPYYQLMPMFVYCSNTYFVAKGPNSLNKKSFFRMFFINWMHCCMPKIAGDLLYMGRLDL